MTVRALVPFDVRLPGRYRVVRVIGRGGAGVVLQAHDSRLRRDVAIKVFLDGPSTPEALISQEREAQLLARSAHPNLVTVFDVGAEEPVEGVEQHLFLVMEHVDGPDLAQWLRLQRADVHQVAQLGQALCSALEFVHRNGVLHCDIKPSNVLLGLGADGELIPKLADFGVAAVLKGQVPQGEFTVGTAAYLSPEQVEGNPLQEPSDVYALGLVLLEAVTGRVAFPGGVIESAVARLDRQPLIDDQGLPPALVEVLRGMTDREPSHRLGLREARAMFRRLAGADDGEGLSTGPQAIARGTGVVADVPVAEAGALRTVDAVARVPAFDRAVALAAHALGAPAALLLLAEDDVLVLQAAYGISLDDGLSLFRDHQLLAMGRLARAPLQRMVTVRVADGRGERLGTLAVIVQEIGPDQQQVLDDVGFLIGQVLEMRAVTRRALLSR